MGYEGEARVADTYSLFRFVVCVVFSHPPQPSVKNRVREDWESHYIIGMSLFFLTSWFVATHGPDTSLSKWAREEALHTGFQVPQPQPDLKD